MPDQTDQWNGAPARAPWNEPAFRQLLETLPAGAYTCDPDGLITYYNQRAAEVWGRVPKLNHPDDRFCGSFALYSTADGSPIGHDQCWMALALQNRQGYNGQEILIERPDGSRITALVHANPIRDASGRLIGAVNVVVDISDHQRAMDVRALLAAIIESSDYAIVSKSLEGRILSWNAGAERLFGYTAAEAVGQKINLIIPPDRQDEEGEILARLRRGERIDHFETVRMAKDGRRLDISVTVSPVRDATGRVVGASKVARDITARKQAEDEIRRTTQTLRTVVHASPLPIVIVDPNPPLVRLWNPAAEALFGWTEAEVVGRPMPIVPDDKQTECRLYLAAVGAGQAFNGAETRRLTKAGTTVFVSLSAAPLHDGAGRVHGILLMFTDITDRKRVEDALREADRAKDEFLATLSHELRNPLAPVRHAVQLLHLKAPPAPEVKWALDVIDRQMHQMVRLIDDLLDVSRITRNKLDLRKERVGLADVVRSAVETSRPHLDAGGQELTVVVPPRPVYVDGDPVRLAQAIANLLNNAAKYTDRGGRIWLTAERQGSDAVVTVRDTGIGIPANMLPRIFEMFTQVDHALSRAQGGLGIGLHLVKRLLELHGGSITAYSAGPGKGSEFMIRLPVLLDSTPGPAADTSDTDPAAPASSLRVLVVDDNRDSAATLGMLLRVMGNEVRTAHDGLEAVGVADEFRPDVAVLDIGLPRLNGYDVAGRIRQQPWGRTMVLIAVTGWGQDSDREQSREAGFDHHLVKPVDPAAVMKLVASLDQSASARRASIHS
jgi:PAS domain S-box-containing protein